MSPHDRPAEIVVLIVDDEPIVRDFVQFALARHGFRVLVATSGYEALEIARAFEGQIHLVLSDVKMPGMNGPQMIETIQRERPGTKFLVMTGKSSGEIPRWLRPTTLEKPFPLKQLIQHVNSVLGRQAE